MTVVGVWHGSEWVRVDQWFLFSWVRRGTRDIYVGCLLLPLLLGSQNRQDPSGHSLVFGLSNPSACYFHYQGASALSSTIALGSGVPSTHLRYPTPCLASGCTCWQCPRQTTSLPGGVNLQLIYINHSPVRLLMKDQGLWTSAQGHGVYTGRHH